MQPLMHDTPDELAQPEILDWGEGECEPMPGKTMPHVRVVERDYANLYNKFISFGPKAREDGISRSGCTSRSRSNTTKCSKIPSSRCLTRGTCVVWSGAASDIRASRTCSTRATRSCCARPESNGEVCYQAFRHEEEHVGLPLVDLAEPTRGVSITFYDLTRQPRRMLTSPCWTGMVNDGRAYSAWCMNVERLVPWRTLTGRQTLYLDHQWYLDFGEHIPTYKPRLNPRKTGDIVKSRVDDKAWC